jgi:two-component system response regulator DevR
MAKAKPAASAMLRITLVEDHPIVRLGLKTVIDAQPDMTVVGEAETVADGIRRAADDGPDLVILALRLQGELRGIELCREIKNLPRAPAVLIYSSFNSSEDLSSSFLSGADGFVHKGADFERLLASVRAAHAGRRPWVPGAEAKEQGARLGHAVEESGLTPRELQVLGFMLQHLTNSDIAKELYVELSTVKTHVSSILRKLGLSSRRELF